MSKINLEKMSKDDITKTLKKIVDSEADAGEDLLFEDKASKKEVLKEEDTVSDHTSDTES